MILYLISIGIFITGIGLEAAYHTGKYHCDNSVDMGSNNDTILEPQMLIGKYKYKYFLKVTFKYD